MDINNLSSQSLQLITPQPEYIMHLSDVGTLTGVIMAAIIGFGYVISKFRRDTTSNAAETALYKNLSDRIESISKTLEKVEAERADLLLKFSKAEARILILEKHEQENAILRKKLQEKEEKITKLQQLINEKQSEIDELKNRVHEL